MRCWQCLPRVQLKRRRRTNNSLRHTLGPRPEERSNADAYTQSRKLDCVASVSKDGVQLVLRDASHLWCDAPQHEEELGILLRPPSSDQCTLTVSSSWLQAFAMAASRLSVSRMGVPSAACRA